MAGAGARGALGRWGRRLGLAAALAAVLPAFAEPALDLEEAVVSVPVTVKAMGGGAQTHDMFITVFRPRGQGPFPLVVINHGRAAEARQRATPPYFRFEDAARFFVRKGFIVLVPTRLGYGATGPGFDPEDGGTARAGTTARWSPPRPRRSWPRSTMAAPWPARTPAGSSWWGNRWGA